MTSRLCLAKRRHSKRVFGLEIGASLHQHGAYCGVAVHGSPVQRAAMKELSKTCDV
jgi:hypothetical protein